MIIFDKIRFKNLLSYGNYFTEISLNQERTSLVVGANGSGKSSLMDAICFALFSRPYRKINKPQLVNSINQKDCVVEIEFSVGNNSYMIRRGLKPNIFEIYEDGKLIDQDSTTKDYQLKLETNILKMNFKSFTQIVLLGSGSFVPFMKLDPKDRRAVIEDVLNINIFSTMNNILKSRISKHKDEIDRLSYDKKIAKDRIKIQKDYIANLQKDKQVRLEQCNSVIVETTKHIEECQAEIDEKIEKTENLLNTVVDKKKITTKLEQLSDIKSKFDKHMATLKKDIKFFEKNAICPTCSQEINSEFKSNIISSKEKKLKDLHDGLVSLERDYDIVTNRVSEISETMKGVREIESEIQEKNNVIRSEQNYIQRIQKEIEELLQTKSEIQPEALATLNSLEEDIVKIEKRESLMADTKYVQQLAYDLLKDSGIKTQIIKMYIPIINKFVNKYLQVLDFFVNFTIDEQFNEKIKSRHRDEFSYDSFSEGQKQRIDLALLFSWRKIAELKNSVNTNLVIFDELLDGSLDDAGVDGFFKLVEQMSKNTNLVVISHKMDLFTDKFDRTLKFSLENNFSKMLVEENKQKQNNESEEGEIQ